MFPDVRIFFTFAIAHCLSTKDGGAQSPVVCVCQDGYVNHVSCITSSLQSIRSVRIGSFDNMEENSITCASSEIQTPLGTFDQARFSTCTRRNMRGPARHTVVVNNHSGKNTSYMCEICYVKEIHGVDTDCYRSEVNELLLQACTGPDDCVMTRELAAAQDATTSTLGPRRTKIFYSGSESIGLRTTDTYCNVKIIAVIVSSITIVAVALTCLKFRVWRSDDNRMLEAPASGEGTKQLVKQDALLLTAGGQP